MKNKVYKKQLLTPENYPAGRILSERIESLLVMRYGTKLKLERDITSSYADTDYKYHLSTISVPESKQKLLIDIRAFIAGAMEMARITS